MVANQEFHIITCPNSQAGALFGGKIAQSAYLALTFVILSFNTLVMKNEFTFNFFVHPVIVFVINICTCCEFQHKGLSASPNSLLREDFLY